MQKLIGTESMDEEEFAAAQTYDDQFWSITVWNIDKTIGKS